MKKQIAISTLAASIATWIFVVELQLMGVHVYAITALSFVLYSVVIHLTVRYMQKHEK